MPDFRPLDADGCAAAFLHPEPVLMAVPRLGGKSRRAGATIGAVGAERTITGQ